MEVNEAFNGGLREGTAVTEVLRVRLLFVAGTAYGGADVACGGVVWLGRTALGVARVSAFDFALGHSVIGLGSRQIRFEP
ncbi:hypothetical protein GOBAR_DD22578 [Gossypium barbadense]|nr:hypothetical protein GOBAR_DD22578 [Gossypium barbadense]